VTTDPKGTVTTDPHNLLRSRRPAGPRARPLLAGLCATALLAGCGGGSSTAGGGPSIAATSPGGSATASATSSEPSAPAAGSGPTTLQVVVTNSSGAATSWKLTCDPAGGNHPDPAAACAALQAHGATALPAVPSDQACTMIYGGPQKASVSGSWRGQRVTASFSRINGCEIARWEALTALFPGSS
jgi:hypothetical protein